MHGVSTWQFLDHLNHWYKTRYPNSKPIPEYLVYGRSLAICSHGKDLVRLISIIEEATSTSGLRAATFQVLHGVTSRKCSGVVKHGRSWCPACFLEWSKAGLVPYDKLQWCCQHIVRCVEHGIRLSECCPSCGRKQRYYDALKPIDVCRNCGASLIGNPATWKRATQPTAGERDVLDLIRFTTSNPRMELVKQAPSKFLNEVHDRQLGITLSRSLGMAQTKLVACGESRQKPTFNSMLKIAAACDVPLVLILTEPKTAATIAALDVKWNKIVGPVHHSRLGKRTRNYIERALTKIVSNPDKDIAPTITCVCHSMCISSGFLAYNYRHLYNAIKIRHRRYITRIQQHKLTAAQRALREDLFVETSIRRDFHVQGCFPFCISGLIALFLEILQQFRNFP